jgi:hypothetical protein
MNLRLRGTEECDMLPTRQSARLSGPPLLRRQQQGGVMHQKSVDPVMLLGTMGFGAGPNCQQGSCSSLITSFEA